VQKTRCFHSNPILKHGPESLVEPASCPSKLSRAHGLMMKKKQLRYGKQTQQFAKPYLGMPAAVARKLLPQIAIAPKSRDADAQAAWAYSFSGDTARARSLVDDLARRFPQDTILQRVWLPTIHSQIEMGRNNSEGGIELLCAVSPYELGMLTGSAINSCLYPVYVRAEAYLKGSPACRKLSKLLR
jgi:hypothetical protein